MLRKVSGIQYELNRKRVKNINLRVDGQSVRVSAPYGVAAETVDAFVARKAQWILTAQRRQAQLTPAYDPHMLVYQGEAYAVEAVEGRYGVVLLPGVARVSVPHPQDGALVERALEKWRQEQIKRLYSQAIEQVLPKLAAQGVARPALRARRMKTRWGSCMVQKGIVTLNTRLLEYPYDCLRYVAAHELCHFVHPDHSPAFYALLASTEPQYKALRERLKQGAATPCRGALPTPLP
ncbi:MAG: SprT family zinc-dependent metalloprotease [Eubacteriales bacterium]|nr:SprT family zinc-dependent metalloprotease [Eubacteriales bacterium]